MEIAHQFYEDQSFFKKLFYENAVLRAQIINQLFVGARELIGDGTTAFVLCDVIGDGQI